MLSRPLTRLAAGLLLGACVETTAPLPPPQELLVVLNAGEASVSIIPLTADQVPVKVPVAAGVPLDGRLAAGREYALVTTGDGDSLSIVDLRLRRLSGTVFLGAGAGARGIALLGDTVAWVALSERNALAMVDLRSRAVLTVPAGVVPKDVIVARGRLFVASANLVPCDPPGEDECPAGPSWLTVHDPVSGGRSGGTDSIPLPGPGNASFMVIGGDGRIYVLSAGGRDALEGRLSIVDPVARTEVANFGGFGERPGPVAADLVERIVVSSRTEGLMDFNTRTRALVRGAGNGIPLQENSGATTDTRNQIYGVEAGTCAGVSPGRVRVFRPDFTEIRTVGVGSCPVAAVTALIPPEEAAGVR